MPSDKELELYRTLTQSQQKYTYFLLAAAAAGIGLSVRITSDATLHWSLLPLGGAVLAWGISFIQGCVHVMYTQSTTHANAALIHVQTGQHPQVGTHPDLVRAATEGIKAAIESNERSSGFHARGQFTLLVLGAILFVAWHVLGIVLRTYTDLAVAA